MANSTQYDVIINVITGHLEKATKELKDMGAATNNVATSQNKAAKAGKAHNDVMNGGVTSANNSARSMSRLIDTVGGNNSGLVAAYATLATNAFAVSAAFNALRNAAGVQQVLAGLEAEGSRLGTTLTLTSKKIQEITDYSVSAADAMKATAQASAAGIKTDSLERMAQVARNASIALGRNMPDALDRIIKGATKLEPELLDELGIMVKLDEATSNYANSIGKPVSALTRFQKSQAYVNAVVAEGEAKFGGLEKSVKPNIYDKLAASFDNLINSVLGSVNSFKPLQLIVGALGDNVYLLGTTVLVFVSSISKALIPSLYSMADASAKAAKRAEENIQVKLKEIQVNKDLAASEHAAAVAKQAATVQVDKGAPPKVKAFFEAATTGSATESMKVSAERGAKISTDIANSKKLKLDEAAATRTLTEEEQKSLDLQNQRIASNKAYIASMAEVMAIQTTMSAEDAARNLITSNLEKKIDIERSTATKNDLKGQALRAAGEKKYSEAIDYTKQATTAYKEQLVQTNALRSENATGKLAKGLAVAEEATIGARTAMFGFSTALRGILTVGLDVIPIIGEIALAVQILWELGSGVWNWLFPPSEAKKALANVEEELTKVLERAKETAKYTTGVFNEGSIASATKQAQAYLSLSNSINEIVDKYKELEAAKKASDLASSNDNISSKSDSFKKQLEQVTQQNIISRMFGSDTQSTEAYKSVVALSEHGYGPLINDLVLATTKSKEFQDAQGDTEKQTQILANALDNAQQKYGTVGQSIDQLKQDYIQLDKSVGGFIQSASIKTPYDELSSSLTKVASDILRLRGEYARGAIDIESFYKQIETISQRSSGVVSKNTQLLGIEVQKLQQQRLIQQASGDYQAAYKSNLQLVEVRSKYNQALYDGIIAAQHQYAEMQKQYVLTEGQIKLENARYNKYSDLLKNTVAGRLAEIAHDEKIRNLQKQKIQSEITSLENMNVNITQRLTDLNVQLQQNKVSQEALKIAQDQLNTLDLITQITTGMLTGQQKQQALDKNAENIAKSKAEQDAANLEIQGSILELTNQQSQLGLSIVNKKQELAALSAEDLSNAEKATQILGIQRDTYAKIEEKQVSMATKIANLSDKRGSLEDNITNKITGRIDAENSAYENQKRALDSQYKIEKDKNDQAIQDVKTRSNIDEKTRSNLIASLKDTFSLKTEEYKLDGDILSATRAINIALLAKIDIYKDGIEIQQQSLAVVEKNIELNKTLISQEQDIALTRARIAAKKQGVELDPKVEQAIAYNAAQKEYQLALATHKMKLDSIDMEYDLLEAQRQATAAELKMKSMILEQYYKAQEGGITSDQQTALSQIRKASDNYASQTYDSARALAKAQENNNLTLLKLKADETGIFSSGSNPVSEMISATEQAATAFKNIMEGNTAKAPDNVLTQSLGVIRPDLQNLKTSLDTNISTLSSTLDKTNLAVPTLEKSLDALNTNFKTLIDHLKSIGELSDAATAGSADSSNTLTGNAKKAMDFFTSVAGGGWSKAQAAGIVGNLQTESYNRLDPKAKNGSHMGIAQWDNSRQEAFATEMGKSLSESTFMDQLKFIAKELKDGYGGTALRSATTPSQAANIVQNKFEVAPGQGTASRVSNAASLYSGYETTPTIAPKATTSAPTINNTIATSMAETAKTAVDNMDTVVPSVIAEWMKLDTTFKIAIEDLSTLGGCFGTLPELQLSAADKLDQFGTKVKAFSVAAAIQMAPFLNNLKSLGPQGEIASAIGQGMLNITSTVGDAAKNISTQMDTINSTTASSQDKFKAYASSVQSALNVVGSMLSAVSAISKASSDAKIAGIDKEIAAEEKKDGKSAASVAKINALEAKKDAQAKKSFETQKKLMMAQAVMSTAAGIAGALGRNPTPMGIAMAAIIGAMGLAQVAIIAGTSYESSYKPSIPTPSSLNIGKQGDTVDLAKGPSANPGGEVAYLRGASGVGSNASNYRTVGSAYGGELMRGYGNRGFVVGEKGPEVITPETPITVTPANDVGGGSPINANFSIQALDSHGVQDILVSQKGNIIKMLREAANASGSTFLENVNTNVYTRPGVNRL